MEDEPRVENVEPLKRVDDDESSVEPTTAPEQLTSLESDGSQQETQSESSSPAEIESKFEQRIRETEERLASQFGSLIERVNQSNRDATRARFEELKARVDELYHIQAAGLDELVAAGKLSPTDAAVQKLQWRDKYERQALAEARQFAQQPQTVVPALVNIAGVWEQSKADVLDALDLTGQEPEYREVMAKWNIAQARDLPGAKAQYKSLAKQVRQAVDTRVGPKSPIRSVTGPATREATMQKRPPILEAGGEGESPSPPNAEKLIEEINALDRVPARTHEERVTRAEKRKRLAAKLRELGE